ncbi:hypothetical protein ABZZ44_21580 [Streptomyces sp. NPDC006460]|uniref:hypothetical protein n=1 Tax=Streptomyces sp. NPDC006460 TaxID=3154304 RepID=UPI0033A5DF4C
MPLQMLVLGCVFVLATLSVGTAIALVAGSARDRFARSPDRLATATGAGGALMIGSVHENEQQMFTTSGGTPHAEDSNGELHTVALHGLAQRMKNTLAGLPLSCDDAPVSLAEDACSFSCVLAVAPG